MISLTSSPDTLSYAYCAPTTCLIAVLQTASLLLFQFLCLHLSLWLIHSSPKYLHGSLNHFCTEFAQMSPLQWTFPQPCWKSKFSNHFPPHPHMLMKVKRDWIKVLQYEVRECWDPAYLIPDPLTFTLWCSSAFVSSSSHRSSGRELKSACHWDTKSCLWSGRLRNCWKLVLWGTERMRQRLHVMPVNCKTRTLETLLT